ncbi:MAG: type ISP restriction/modification enzyme [Ignavibacteriaceae bacterium]|jgi:type I restriction-modification system DNA methylase subunit|nr:type ISP restriction/modification enzyme [Ignavibacteriaceae bacterium]
MKNISETYIKSISKKFSYEETSELGYRTDFEILIMGIFESINVRRIDHDAKAKDGNKPDFVILKHSLPILYIEAKAIGISLDKIEKSEQMARYFGYANLVLTDYVEFRFYRNGMSYQEPIKIGNYDTKHKTIVALPENFEHLSKCLIDFAQTHKEPIRSGAHLAKIMGGKAQRIRDNVKRFTSYESEKNASIMKVYDAIKKQLVHDLTPDSFADMYAQTLVYGLFVARYYDETPDNFSRREARDLVPKSNPLLRHFFDHIVGTDFDTRLEYIVNELCEVFSHADVQELMKQYFSDDVWGNTHGGPDPVIHFYEDFLKEYDPELRKKLGAYYTPQPVVRFIVRAVDHILENEFGLFQGLADTSKLPSGIHKIQILDPAVGTGTFISATIRIIYERLIKSGQKGRWLSYVHHDLLPRLHGFELMMAPYTIAHLKLGMAFKKTGFWKFNNRLGIYLTNSLEESEVRSDLFADFGFAGSIAEESKEASKIKNRTPIMVVIGNPPYSVSSANKGKWILELIKDYKKNLNEKKINLDDDYIKFIRFAEHFIEQNKTGIVAMITNNSFIDGITHRQMRKHLLETFDDIYILDLHGNSKKKERAPDGSKDENVFDIQQGVSISIFVRKTVDKKNLGIVYHTELFGLRVDKFKSLNESDLLNINWNRLDYSEPSYFFTPKDFKNIDKQNKLIKIEDLMPLHNSGIQTKNDLLAVSSDLTILEKVINDFRTLDVLKLKDKYSDRKESSGWNFLNAKKDILNDYKIVKYNYRPFDFRFLVYTGRSSGYIGRSRAETSKHFLEKNIGLAVMKQVFHDIEYNHVIVTDSMIDERTNYSNRGGTYLFPLYLYSEDGTKHPNLNKKIVDQIEKIVGKVSPENIFDYIYAVLHSPAYREKYREFLKIDFPRVPYPTDLRSFKALVNLGTELRALHLLKSPKLNKYITTYPNAGSDKVEKLSYEDGNVFINKEQYFGNVPETSWNFYIGGYQPAQKWLKDRKNRILTNEEIEHYQKIIVALWETERIMMEIDKIVSKLL